MKTLALLAMLILAGCTAAPNPDSTTRSPSRRYPTKAEFWQPSVAERSKADRLGREFALTHLGLTKPEIDKMLPDFTGLFENGSPIIWVQFYDPVHHQPLPNGGLEAIEGGFPTYFTVSVDTVNWEVIDHYASPE